MRWQTDWFYWSDGFLNSALLQVSLQIDVFHLEFSQAVEPQPSRLEPISSSNTKIRRLRIRRKTRIKFQRRNGLEVTRVKVGLLSVSLFEQRTSLVRVPSVRAKRACYSVCNCFHIWPVGILKWHRGLRRASAFRNGFGKVCLPADAIHERTRAEQLPEAMTLVPLTEISEDCEDTK